MAFGLKKVFSKGDNRGEQMFVVTEPTDFGIKQAENAFYQNLYPPAPAQPLTVPQKLVIDVLKNSLQKREFRDKAVPRLPHVIPRLLKSLRDPDSSVKDYVRIVNKDPVMSAAVLKLANSVYFNPIGARIDEIERAIVKLGIDGLRAVLSAAVMQPVIQRESPYFSHVGQKIWQHSLCCAVACEIIAQHRQVEKFKMYVMGLIHDIGKITIFSELCKQFQIDGPDGSPSGDAFVPLMTVLAPAVSYWVAKDWELPKEICKALAEQVNIQAQNSVSQYGHVLYQANLVTEAYAVLRPRNKPLAEAILPALELPTDLYQKLDQLAAEV